MTTDIVLGIDEAGKNPLMGPMVVAGFLAPQASEAELLAIGIKDSKAFGSGERARGRRHTLAARLRKMGRFNLQLVSAAEIDRHKLNDLIYLAARKIVAALGTRARIRTDGGEYFQRLAAPGRDLQVINGGDHRNVFISAASILAKDERDRCWASIAEGQRAEVEELLGAGDGFERFLDGCAYPASQACRQYLTLYHARHADFPPQTRRRLVPPAITAGTKDGDV